MKRLAAALSLALFMLGCVAQLSREAKQVRAMTDLDMPSCHNIKTVWSEPWNDVFSYRTPDADFEDAFNEALNAVAAVGGNAYRISGGSGLGYMVLEAWHCDWEGDASPILARSTSEPKEIYSIDRPKCSFVTTLTEASNWGITEKRNTSSAKRDVIKQVQNAGGDSYFIVDSFWNSGAGTAFIIVEAWRCK
jgi:hypothetical protein